MTFLRQALLIARRDVALIVWRPEGLAWIFVMPIVFTYLLAIATGGLGPLAAGENGPYALALRAPAASGLLVDELIARLEQENFRVELSVPDDAWQTYARRLVVAPSADGVPPPDGSLTAWALAGNTIELRYESELDEPAAALDRFRVARAAYTVFADAAVIASRGAEFDGASVAALAAMPRTVRVDVRAAGRRETPPAGIAQAVPGTLVLFIMLIALTGGAIHLVIERNQGLLRRLASTPVSRGSIVIGKLGGRAAVAAIQIAFAVATGSLLFGLDWGPALPMVVLVLLGWALFNAGFSLLLGNLVGTEAQAMGIGIVTTTVLAALGGVWWPIEIAPDWMQRLALLIPTGWSMDAMHKLVSFGYGPASALPHLAGLLAAAFVLGWASVRSFRFS